MELVPHPSLPSQVVLGPHVTAGVDKLTAQSQAEQVLIVVVKAVFAHDDPAARPVPPSPEEPPYLREVARTDVVGPDGTFDQEHDLAADKPLADVVVLGPPAPPEPDPVDGKWTERVERGPDSMKADFPVTLPPRHAFGWEPRTDDPRLSLAGSGFVPATMMLPPGFSNRFFNGGRYTAGDRPAFTHPPAGAAITVETSALYPKAGGGSERRFITHTLRLPATPPAATITWRTAAEPGAPTTRQAIDLRADTIVYHKGSGRYSVAWRGVWRFDTVPADRYVNLVLS
jgi:hypothetical protein